jgi:hypothetical protein
MVTIWTWKIDDSSQEGSQTLNVISGITTDIQGNTRPFGNGSWDIGADEYAHKVIYRSNGPNSTGALICATSTNN